VLKHRSSYLTESSNILFDIRNKATPIPMNERPTKSRIQIILPAVGIGRQAGKVCYLKLFALSCSIFYRIAYFSSGVDSIFIKIFTFLKFNFK